MSLRAGGVGLNLIGGSHLFLVDQHWYDRFLYIMTIIILDRFCYKCKRRKYTYERN